MYDRGTERLDHEFNSVHILKKLRELKVVLNEEKKQDKALRLKIENSKYNIIDFVIMTSSRVKMIVSVIQSLV